LIRSQPTVGEKFPWDPLIFLAIKLHVHNESKHWQWGVSAPAVQSWPEWCSWECTAFLAGQTLLIQTPTLLRLASRSPSDRVHRKLARQPKIKINTQLLNWTLRACIYLRYLLVSNHGWRRIGKLKKCIILITFNWSGLYLRKWRLLLQSLTPATIPIRIQLDISCSLIGNGQEGFKVALKWFLFTTFTKNFKSEMFRIFPIGFQVENWSDLMGFRPDFSYEFPIYFLPN
jgi:hypothetical protein